MFLLEFPDGLTWLLYHHNSECTLSLPVKKLLIGLAEGKACPAHSHVLQQSKVFHLMTAALIIKYLWGLLVIGFDATHIVWFLKE